jgi:quercetin dioxygenase-like cupin family protein
MMKQSKMWICASVALVGLTGLVRAQNSGVTRTVVTTADVSVANREAVQARVEIAPAGVIGWHTHPGDEVSYVTDGVVTLLVAGKPPRRVVAGEGFVIPAGVVHSAKNEGSSAAKLLVVYVVEKGKALVSEAPAPAQ